MCVATSAHTTLSSGAQFVLGKQQQQPVLSLCCTVAVFASTTKGYLWWSQTQSAAYTSHSSLMALKMHKNQVNCMVHKMPNAAFHFQDTVPVFYITVPSVKASSNISSLIQVQQLFIRSLRIYSLKFYFVRSNPKSLWFWTSIRLYHKGHPRETTQPAAGSAGSAPRPLSCCRWSPRCALITGSWQWDRQGQLQPAAAGASHGRCHCSLLLPLRLGCPVLCTGGHSLSVLTLPVCSEPRALGCGDTSRELTAPPLPRLLSDPPFTNSLSIVNMGSRNFPCLTFVVFFPQRNSPLITTRKISYLSHQY